MQRMVMIMTLYAYVLEAREGRKRPRILLYELDCNATTDGYHFQLKKEQTSSCSRMVKKEELFSATSKNFDLGVAPFISLFMLKRNDDFFRDECEDAIKRQFENAPSSTAKNVYLNAITAFPVLTSW